MPVIEINLPEIERMTNVDREVILDQIPMIGADVERVEGEKAYIEFFPNRPDLFSIEGVSRALKGFLEIETGLPKYNTVDGDVEMQIEPTVKKVRPEAVGAVVRDLDLNENSIKTIMDLQEDLHWGLGRDRKKVSIGIHNLKEIQPPFTYKAVEPDRYSFIPLEKEEEMNLTQILREHKKGREYGDIVKNSDKYPVITDRENQVLSFPPVINSKLTQVDENTEEVFIDVTGTQRHSIEKALNIITTALAERNGVIEKIKLSGTENRETPNLKPTKKTIKHQEIKKLVGNDITIKESIKALKKMRYHAEQQNQKIKVKAPSYRADIIHDWDIIEDIAIGHGYQKLDPELPNTPGVGSSHQTEKIGDQMRDIMTGLGYHEAMTLTLTNREETKKLNQKPRNPVKIENPISTDHTILRTTILPKLMEILKLNRHRDLPQKIFEYGECFHKNTKQEIDECYHLSAVSIGSEMNYSQIKSTTEAILREIDTEYKINKTKNGPYIQGRGADITVDGEKIGEFGEIHPEVISSYDLEHPTTALEIEPEKII